VAIDEEPCARSAATRSEETTAQPLSVKFRLGGSTRGYAEEVEEDDLFRDSRGTREFRETLTRHAAPHELVPAPIIHVPRFSKQDGEGGDGPEENHDVGNVDTFGLAAESADENDAAGYRA
jgi:hypothetical protein